ncbi:MULTISPECIES: DUF7144 family membrane protein [Aeromicrobium]|uniref:DUF7144 domain-containing protein n=1 Tax=Aeromicrobium phoceense TaxID=2754045 RepID=A0A838XJ77_9ACTN|nr:MULTISPECIES: hypothetical protein [Aeromicrobium]MBA4609061.1 hypothetical protein [Aeromicrobium phoceense]
MSRTAEPAGPATTPSSDYQTVQPSSVSGWAGWVYFAAFMLLLLGVLHAITGLVALFKDEYFVVASSGLVVNADYTAWGWAHLIGGIIVALAGLSLMSGATWARIVAVLVAMLSVIVNFAFMAAYPFWSVLMVTISLLVIWAVIVHGDELRNA